MNELVTVVVAGLPARSISAGLMVSVIVVLMMLVCVVEIVCVTAGGMEVVVMNGGRRN